MAENAKQKFDLPWATLLPLLAVLAGVVAQYKPLVSERPSVASEKTAPVFAAQDVDARLWQDPIGVAEKQKALLDEQTEKDVAKKDIADSHALSALATRIRQDARSPGNVLLLAVMLDSGPYSEQAESRLRSRQAVLEGLSESGFVPVDGEHIGFVTDDWPPNDPSGLRTIPRALLLPWEECVAVDEPARVFPKNTGRVIILWLPAASFNPYPLNRFAYLVDQLVRDVPPDKVDLKLIGPANSTGLQNMIGEVREHNIRPETKNRLRGVWIVSPRATASADFLLFGADHVEETGSASASSKKLVEEFLQKAIPGLQFYRTVAPDDWVLEKLIAELARRRVPVSQQTTPDGRAIVKPAHVVILSEWDTAYGRSLATAFGAKASGRNTDEIIQHPDSWPPWVHSYHYLRGIDGRLPGDEPKENQTDQAPKVQPGRDTVAVEATEGLNQSDYLQRLARQMREDDTSWKRDDGFGIRAIGLLGSDIYDKLLILRALRPQFPDVVFFTNNYDAHFERRNDLDDTHNLVVISPFGGTLPEIYVQQHVAPFRDSNQTATYVGTLVATTKMKQEEADCLSWQPRIFEVSRHGTYGLSPPWYLWHPGDSKVVPESLLHNDQHADTWFRDWLFAPGVTWKLIVIALAVLALAVWISASIARRTLPGGGTAVERLKLALVSTTFWLVFGAPLIVFFVALLAQYVAPEEPLAFFSGISIWPTEMLRLIAFMLAIFFMFKASFDLRRNAKKIEDQFGFDPLPLTRFQWRDLGIGFEDWQMKEHPEKSRFSAEEAWHAYLCRNKFWPRFIRVGILFTLFFIFAVTVLALFPEPPPPARGEGAFKVDKLVFILAGVGMLLLSFYVVDAIQLKSNFIRMFGREFTRWGRRVVKESHRSPPLKEKELSAYNEIFFVAQRTQAIAPLIWYPLIVLTLLVVARFSLFDNWTWPAGLVLVCVTTAGWALGSAIFLRRAAEQLRETALNELRRFRLLGLEIEAKRETFDELMTEIRRLKTGAFAPLTEQPFIHAVLFPGGGLGLIAVAQRLFDLF